MRSEAAYQKYLISHIQDIFPDSVVIKNDPRMIQGIPDLLVLWRNGWAMLEVKLSESAPIQPNQQYYIDLFNQMSFAAFIYPENEEQVLYDLQSTLWALR
jgi:hypothetical protein